MEYMNARSSQRFLTYIIDFFLIQIVVSFIVSFIPAYVDGMEYILEFYRSILQGELTENIEILTRVMKKAIKLLGIILSDIFHVAVISLNAIICLSLQQRYNRSKENNQKKEHSALSHPV